MFDQFFSDERPVAGLLDDLPLLLKPSLSKRYCVTRSVCYSFGGERAKTILLRSSTFCFVSFLFFERRSGFTEKVKTSTRKIKRPKFKTGAF